MNPYSNTGNETISNNGIITTEENSTDKSQKDLDPVRKSLNPNAIATDINFDGAPKRTLTYISRWVRSKLRPYMVIFGTVMFVSISIIIGISVIIFTTPDQLNSPCLFTFKPVVTNSSSQNSRPIAIASGDLNNDGIIDVVVANSEIDNIQILIGDGTGAFINQYFLSTGFRSYPCSVAISNFNNDNKLDIVVANHDTHSLWIFLGDGDGNFTFQMSYMTGTSHPLYVTTGDFNNDDRSDIVVVNDGTNSISILIGDGNGSFEMSTSYPTGYDSIPYYAVVADVNKDKRLDIIVTNYGTNNIGILLGYGNGTLANQTTFTTGLGSYPYVLVVADFNNDKNLDIAVTYSGTGNIGIFLAYGNGTFADQLLIPINIVGPMHIVVSDFNKDTKLDIAVTVSTSDVIEIMLGFGNGTFGNPAKYSTSFGSYPIMIAAADLNNDNRSDIIVTNNGTNNVGVLLGYDPGALQNQTTYPTGSNSYPISVVVCDLNNDNQLDIVIANYGSSNVGIFLGLGDGTFQQQNTYSTGDSSAPECIAIGDVNNDNRLDIVFVDYPNAMLGVLFDLGNGTYGRLITYSTGTNSQPSSVALGDFDNDKRLDIVVVNSNSNNIRLFFGLGNGTFGRQISYSTGGSSVPYYLTVGDLDNDGQLDIVVTNSATNNAGIFFGFGNGSFAQQITYSTGFYSRPYFVVVADLNDDSRLDIVVANRHSDTVGILLGLGNRTFASVNNYKTGSYYTPFSVTVGDFNSDKRLDIAVANRDVSMVGIFLGFGNGTFGEQTTFITGTNARPYCLAAGDFNNDGRSDLAVVNTYGYNLGVFLGYDGGALKNQTTYSTGSAPVPVSVDLGDFNGDNKLDIVVANFGTNNIAVLIQEGVEDFRNQIMFSTGLDSNPISVAVGDVDNNNRLDIVVANYASSTIGVFLGLGNGSFLNQITYTTGIDSFPSSVILADFNHDNRSDIIVTNSNNDNVNVFLTYPYSSFRQQVSYSSASDSAPYSVGVGDFNNDSLLDIAIADYFYSNIGIFLGLGDGTFQQPMIYSLNQSYCLGSIAIADIDNDYRLDIVFVDFCGNNVGILFGAGNGSFSRQILYSTGTNSAPYSVAINDLDKDKRLDIVVANSNTNTIRIFFGLGNGTFGRQNSYSTGTDSNPYYVAISDLNNDTRLDIIAANQLGNNIGIFLGYGNGSFGNQITYSTGTNSNPFYVVVNDFNNDHRMDIVVANYGNSNVGIFLGVGDGTFGNQTTYSMDSGTCPSAVSSGDFNNDGRLDIAVVTYYGNFMAILLGFGDGTFDNKMVYPTGTGSFSLSLVVTDFNDDKLLDVVVANSGTANVGVFLGYCCEPFRSQSIYDTGYNSNPNMVAVGDLNNDNQLDIVVANYGTNNIGILFGYRNGTFAKQITYSFDSDSSPYSIAIGDFNNDGWQDLAIASHGTYYISVLLATGDGNFANQTFYWIGVAVRLSAIVVGDFNNDKQLDIAVSNDGTNNVGILYGTGNGTFGMVNLYSTGYNSWACSLVVGDLNNGTQLDIVVAERGKNIIEILSKFC